jgi:HPt (histidine-containing phosphotransfer) domain-containing protein
MEKRNIKTRDIYFDNSHPDKQQARTAAERLAGVAGILDATALSDNHLRLTYHLLEINLAQIEEALDEAGFFLKNNLINKLRDALFFYTEETERANQGCNRGDSNCTRKVFIARYNQINHGCRDTRPDHWRRYL